MALFCFAYNKPLSLSIYIQIQAPIPTPAANMTYQTTGIKYGIQNPFFFSCKKCILPSSCGKVDKSNQAHRPDDKADYVYYNFHQIAKITTSLPFFFCFASLPERNHISHINASLDTNPFEQNLPRYSASDDNLALGISFFVYFLHHFVCCTQ